MTTYANARTITAELLTAKGACQHQIDLFRELFPDGAPMTVEAAAAVAGRFDWDWASENLLSAPARKAYAEAIAPAQKAYAEATAPAWKAYAEAKATAWKAYDEAIAPAWKAYDEAIATARKAYDEAIAPARKAYAEAIAPAQKAYDEAKATAFAEAYLSKARGQA